MELLQRFLYALPENPEWQRRRKHHAEFRVTTSFDVRGVGTVVGDAVLGEEVGVAGGDESVAHHEPGGAVVGGQSVRRRAGGGPLRGGAHGTDSRRTEPTDLAAAPHGHR